MKIQIIKNGKKFIYFSLFTVLLSLASIFYFGFNLGIDFKGGTVYEIKYNNNIPKTEDIRKAVYSVGFQQFNVQKLGEDSFAIRLPELSDETKIRLNEALTFNDTKKFNQLSDQTISSTVSSEFLNKSIFAIILVSLAIVLFITYAFAGVSYPVSSFKYGLIAIVALLHDIIIPTGFFAYMGAHDFRFEINVLFVTALLAILGYSVNDTIVVFDRIRENLKKVKNPEKIKDKEFEEIVEKSLHQTFRRSLFTSLTTLIVLLSLYFFGGESTREFSLVLIIGVIAGTYSSIFLASPLLVMVEKKWKTKPENIRKKMSEMTDEEQIKELTSL